MGVLAAIVRIIGNELPSFHKPGTHLEQLRFILANEPRGADVMKIWLLNRIVDPGLEKTLVNELKAQECTYVSLPFDIAQYRTALRHIPNVHWFSPPHLRRRITLQKAGLIIGSNHARNKAMAVGAPHARWVIPLDGDYCFNQSGFDAMLATAQSAQRRAYALPAYRLADKGDYASFNREHYTMHESMLMLEGDMEHPFDEGKLYGSGDKSGTIRRYFPASALKETPCATLIHHPDYHAGYVLQLPSGDKHARKRRALRMKGLANLIRRVEAKL